MEKHCQIEFNENSFRINGISADPITIDASGDIDVTLLVERLIQLIDVEDSIVLDTQEDSNWDEKKKMVFRLVCKIFEKYNACLTENSIEPKPINSSEYKGNTDALDHLSSTYDSDDLPF